MDADLFGHGEWHLLSPKVAWAEVVRLFGRGSMKRMYTHLFYEHDWGPFNATVRAFITGDTDLKLTRKHVVFVNLVNKLAEKASPAHVWRIEHVHPLLRF